MTSNRQLNNLKDLLFKFETKVVIDDLYGDKELYYQLSNGAVSPDGGNKIFFNEQDFDSKYNLSYNDVLLPEPDTIWRRDKILITYDFFLNQLMDSLLVEIDKNIMIMPIENTKKYITEIYDFLDFQFDKVLKELNNYCDIEDYLSQISKITENELKCSTLESMDKAIEILNVWDIQRKNLSVFLYDVFKNKYALFLKLDDEPTNNNKTEIHIDISTPRFIEMYKNKIFEILSPFFNPDDQLELNLLLNNERKQSFYLVFMDNGNKLAQAFKDLKTVQIITGCNQKKLQEWICKNFQYISRGKLTEFKPNYLDSIISGKTIPCKRPILEIKKNVGTGDYLLTKA